MNKLKADVEAAEKEIREKQDTMKAQAIELKDMTPESDEYKETEESLTRSQVDLNIKMQMQRRNLMAVEATAYHETYSDIETEVNSNAQEHQIDIVLRFSGDPVDEKKPDSILANMNKPIIWYGKKLDITSAILQQIEEKQAKSTAEEKSKEEKDKEDKPQAESPKEEKGE
jgi:hypothetical protein